MHLPLLHAALFTPMGRGRWGLPILFEGEPGVAKTSILEDFAARISAGTPGGFPCEVLSPGERGEGAFGVVPVPAQRGDAVLLTYPPPEWSSAFAAAQRGLVFCDEVTSAPAMIQAPMLGLLTGRRIGGAQLPPGTRLIGAANPVELAAYGHDLAPPLANRFGWIKWRNPTADEHAAYMMGTATEEVGEPIDAAREEARVMMAWPEAYARAVGLETAFLRAQPNWKNMCPKAGDPKASRAWPSDRSWTYAARAHAGAIVHRLDEKLRDEMMAGFVGEVAYEAYSVWAEHADMPDAAAVLDGHEKFKHDPRRLDRTAALLAACTTLAVSTTDAETRNRRATTLWGVLGDVGGHAQDLVVGSATTLTRSRLHCATPDQLRAATRILADLQHVVELAGITAGQAVVA